MVMCLHTSWWNQPWPCFKQKVQIYFNSFIYYTCSVTHFKLPRSETSAGTLFSSSSAWRSICQKKKNLQAYSFLIILLKNNLLSLFEVTTPGWWNLGTQSQIIWPKKKQSKTNNLAMDSSLFQIFIPIVSTSENIVNNINVIVRRQVK